MRKKPYVSVLDDAFNQLDQEHMFIFINAVVYEDVTGHIVMSY